LVLSLTQSLSRLNVPHSITMSTRKECSHLINVIHSDCRRGGSALGSGGLFGDQLTAVVEELERKS
jgi:hypothetical protein